MKVDLDNWSDAELDFISAKAVLSVLGEVMHADGSDSDHKDTVFAAYRLIESGLSCVECGLKNPAA